MIVAENIAWSLAIADAARRHGLDVQVANSASEALRRARRTRDVRPLLFTAVVLPDGSGLALVKRMRRIHPDLKAIYVSSDDDPVSISGALDARSGFLFWPFTEESLSQKIDWLLAARL